MDYETKFENFAELTRNLEVMEGGRSLLGLLSAHFAEHGRELPVSTVAGALDFLAVSMQAQSWDTAMLAERFNPVEEIPAADLAEAFKAV